MKSHSLNILLCCCLLSGCATEFAYNRKCRSFINRPVMDLLYEFGSPVRTYNTGDVEVLEFYSERQVYEQFYAAAAHRNSKQLSPNYRLFAKQR